MRNRLVLPGLMFFASCVAPSVSSEERVVLETVQAFFDVIETKDVEAGAELVILDGVFVNIRAEDGARSVRHFSNADWLVGLQAQTSEMRESFEGSPVVLIEGDVATVWTRYSFTIDGEPSHAGIDAFNLVRTNAGWKISGGAYSVVR